MAHLDRCPHRNAPLSGGVCRKDDTLECPYHGWRFSPDGTCVAIPGSTRAPKETHAVETFSTREQYGFVWLFPSLGESTFPPLAVPEGLDQTYTTFVRRAHYPGNMHAVIENALDVPHTAVLHRGLFRSGKEGKQVDVFMRRYKTWAEAEFVGEKLPQGVMGRLLTLGSKTKLRDLSLQHWDRFVLPSVLQVEYRIGSGSHFLITGFCSPRSETATDLFALVCLRTPLPRFLERLLVFFIEPFAWKVVEQDVAVLKAQTEAIEHFGGERFMSTEIDVLGTPIARLLKDASDREKMEDTEPLDTSIVDRSEEPREEGRLTILV